MVEQAKSHASDDEKKRKEIDTRNKLDALIYSTEKLVNESRDKLPEAETKTIDEAIAEAKKVLEEGSADQMEQALERLTQASHQVASVLYQSASAEGGDTPRRRSRLARRHIGWSRRRCDRCGVRRRRRRRRELTSGGELDHRMAIEAWGRLWTADLPGPRLGDSCS